MALTWTDEQRYPCNHCLVLHPPERSPYPQLVGQERFRLPKGLLPRMKELSWRRGVSSTCSKEENNMLALLSYKQLASECPVF